MKKYLSIFELLSRNTIYKVLLVLLAMGISQILMFYRVMSEWIPMDLYDLNFQAIEQYSLEWMIDKSNTAGFMGLAFVLLTAILCWNGCNIGSKSSYIIQRLQVSEKGIFVMQSVYNIFCYGLLLGVQIAVLLVQCEMYLQQGADVTNQTVFLAFYRNDFMHSVLPMEDTLRWISNGMIMFGCGVSAAVFTYLQRRGRLAWFMLIVVAIVILGFVHEIGNQMALMAAILVLAIAGITSYCHILQKKEGD